MRIARAVVAVPLGLDDLAGPARRWLSRSRVERGRARREWLPRILEALGLPVPSGGLAALRYWEQTGAPPDGWVAAADPVWLEAEMNRLRLHALPAAARAPGDVQEAFAWLEQRLDPEGTGGRFVALADVGYFVAAQPIATAELSPELAQGPAPERWLPDSRAAAAHQRLLTEIQMCLHDADVNRRRAAAGMPPVNALWLWGGGTAPAPAARANLPVLFADDAVLRGYWRASAARAHRWPGTIGGCLGAAGGDFVALAPPTSGGELLEAVREAVARRAIGRLTLLFADGASADVRPADRFHFWRRAADLPPGPPAG